MLHNSHCINSIIAVGDRMLLGMQDFDFAQIESNFSKFCLNFAQISLKPKPNLPKSNQSIC